jgi:hypothetical protein
VMPDGKATQPPGESLDIGMAEKEE